MSCVYEADQMSLECVLEIYTKIKTEGMSTTVFRMAIKQIDCGLAQFGKPDISLLQSKNQTEILDEIKATCDNPGIASLSQYKALFLLLLQLLKYL